MKLTWLGHSCFLLEQDGVRLVTDPYTGVPGYPELNVEAHAVYCSHQHFDHNAVDRVRLLPAPARNPFTVREIAAFHDSRRGALRGANTLRVFTADGVSVVHLGDLGHQLSPEQRRAVGTPDVLLIPVGGTYTIDADAAKQVCDTLSPRCVVPMHYHHAPYGLPNLDGVERFLSLWPAESVHRLDAPSLTVTPDLSGVFVPTFR